MNNAEKIVAVLLDGKVGDWLADRWDDVKHVAGEFAGIGRDDYGLGKPEKGFKPKYGPTGTTFIRRPKTTRRPPPEPPGNEKTWTVG